jgi:CheY-like chemotaxis protein
MENVVRAMLVCQDTEFSDGLSRHLADHGLESTAVINGTAALDRCESSEVDIILLCLDLPDMDGLEACRLIRSVSSEGYRKLTLADFHGSQLNCY